MPSQQEKAHCFRALHVPGRPLVLFNAWDAGSACAIARSGAQAIGTSSWSVAAACGFQDGEKLPRALAIGNFGRIVEATALPVTADIESGYGLSPAEVGETVRQSVDAGVVGFNLEDSFADDGSLREIADQVARIGAARGAIEQSGIECFLNARTDVFFQPSSEGHGHDSVGAVLERARAYAQAGADGLFVPGVVDLSLIAEICSCSPLPLNVMMVDGTPPTEKLREAGVARLSYGPAPYAEAMKALEAQAGAVLDL